jgi:hypothetical protein
MRVRHITQAAMGWPDASVEDTKAGASVAETIERIRWRLWHGQVRRGLDLIRRNRGWHSIDRIRNVMPAVKGERGQVPGLSISLRNTAPAYVLNFDHRRHSELPGQSAHEQVATDAMVPARR